MDGIDKTNLSDQTKFRLDETKKIKDYFNTEINERKLCSKKMSKYVTTFHYIDKILIILNATTGGVYIISHATVVGVPIGISSAEFSIAFALTTGIIKKLLKATRNKQTNKNMIKLLFWLKANLVALRL